MAIGSMPESNMTLERLHSLYELTRRINSVDNLEELLHFILERTLTLTRGEQGLILLNDKSEHKLKHVAISPQWPHQALSLEEVLKVMSSTVIKDVLNQGQPRLIADLHHEISLKSDTLQHKKIRSVLAVPLKVGQQIVGLIYIDHPQAAQLGPQELEFLMAFADQTAFAIYHTQRYQIQIQELTLLNELSRSLVQVLDLDEVLTRIVSEATRMLHVENGSVLLLDESKSELIFATSVANGQRVEIPTRLQLNQGIAGWVVTQGQPVSINNTNRDNRWFGEVAEGFETSSLLCVPLKHNDHILGALQVLNKKGPEGFDDSDTALLSAFAASATIAIENARLFQEAHQARRLQTLHEATLALTSTLNLDTILAVGLEKTLAMLEATIGAITLLDSQIEPNYLYTETSQSLAIVSNHFTEQHSKLLLHLSPPTLNWQKNQIFIIDSVHPLQIIPEQTLHEANIKALAIAPIEVGGQVSGMLAVLESQPHTYSLDETNLLESMGRIIGLAVQNAIHYDKVRSQALRLSYLNEVGTALTRSLDTTQVLNVIMDGVETLLENEGVFIFLIEPQSNNLVLSYSSQVKPQSQGRLFQRQIAQWVVKHHQPVLLDANSTSPSHLWKLVLTAHYETASILCVPLKIEEVILGVVQVLGRKQGHLFSHKDQALLIELTRWAAIALHNAHLFDERVKAYQHLATEQQRRVAAETRAAMATIILDMTHTMNNVMGAIRVWATRLESLAVANQEIPLAHFRKELTQIRQNSEEAIKLIGKITAPLDIPEMVATDVAQCLVKAIQSCWWPDNVQLQTNYASHLPLVKANANRLETVFHNLISNATQALAASGGEVFIKTRLTLKKWVEITISDNGLGIPLELQPKMFNPGVSGKEGGLGIGLWLVDTFVRQFDGKIDFKSTTGNTTFTITLQPYQ